MTLNPVAVEELVRRALLEDVGPGDLATSAVVPEDARCTATIVAGAAGVLCGHPVAQAVFRAVDPALVYERLVPEGGAVDDGVPVASVSGPARPILTAERVAVSLLQRMSGIATATRQLADAIKYYHARLVAGWETVPDLRVIAQYAVRIGGGQVQPYGPTGGILVRAGHLALAGGVREAVVAARKGAPPTSRIAVEVASLEQVQEGVDGGADILVLTGMDPETVKRAVEMAAGKAALEVCGSADPAHVTELAKTGVDIISVCDLAHTARPLPFRLSFGDPKALEKED